MKFFRSAVVLGLLLAALAPAGAAAAETRTYFNNEGFGPREAGGTFGPANHYPGIVDVSGVGGTVLGVTLTVVNLNASADLDMALVGPDGTQVMLMSDACASKSASRVDWTFDDEAPVFVSQLSCPLGGRESVKPSNYGNPELDTFAPGGGPVGPFTNELSDFAGSSPDGEWKVFMIDDTEGTVGFEMNAFALNLEIEPPPPAVRTVTVTEKVPGPVTTVTVPAPGPVGPAPAAKTGKRAAALAKCKKKKAPKARAACRAAARKLPV